MPLNKDILGLDLYNRFNAFNEVAISPADLEARRLDFCKQLAEAVINHIKVNAVLNIPALGFISAAAGAPVTGTSTTGTIA